MALGDPPVGNWPGVFDWRQPASDPKEAQAMVETYENTWMAQFEENVLLTVQAVQRLHAALHARMP